MEGRRSQSVGPELQPEEEATVNAVRRNAVDQALATTGEAVDNVGKLQLFTAFRGWFISRRPLRPDVIAKYESRLRKIDMTTIALWRTAQSKGADVGNSPTLTLAAIAFQDFFVRGRRMEKGQSRTGGGARQFSQQRCCSALARACEGRTLRSLSAPQRG